jgi:hypothetical protein
MKEAELKELVRQSHVQPIRIRVDDGREYALSHPDFGFVANGTFILAHGPRHDLGGPGFVLLPLNHVSRVELSRKKSRTAV